MVYEIQRVVQNFKLKKTFQPLIEKMASEDVESEETVVIMSETVKEEAAQDVEMVSVRVPNY